MAKTGKQIEQEVWRLVKNTELARAISGGVYRSGMRPRDSRKEDIVVRFTAADAEEWQSGVVTVLIYVPDIDVADSGTKVEDGMRISALEAMAAQMVDEIDSDPGTFLQFDLSEAISSYEDSAISQHFISIKLNINTLNS